MSDYENMIVSAVRYALGRMTYIVEITVNYVLQEIEDDKLSGQCLNIIRQDIKNTKSYGNVIHKMQWIKLWDKIEEVI